MIHRSKFIRFIRFCIFLCVILNFSSCASGSTTPPDRMSYKMDISDKKFRQNIVEYARYFLERPYRKCGRDEKGFDCSGFVSYVLKNFHIALPASSQDQSNVGKSIKIADTSPGDLVFFGDKKRIHHVGIITENHKDVLMVIHSSSSNGVIEENVLKSDYWHKRIRKFTNIQSYRTNKLVSNP
ncbi:MAG: C40 family peptidase [Saprospiraceae bacterium]